MSRAGAAWVDAIDPPFVDRRFGAAAVTSALGAPRRYAESPRLDASSNIVASIIATPGGSRLTAPVRVVVRVREGDVLDFSCACRSRHVCDHVVWLLVDVAFHAALRKAIVAAEATEPRAAELERVRALALEERTLDDRLAEWLPPRTFDETWEIDVEAVTIASAAAGDERAALLLRHRRPSARGLVAAKDVLASRLRARHRRLVDLTSPYHLDRNALVATRGQASILAHLLREEIGLHAGGFKGRARFANAKVRLRAVREEDRLVARWFSEDGTYAGDARTTFLLAGPFPYLWDPLTSTFHEVSKDVDLDAALGMHRVPSLPVGEASAGRVGRALLAYGSRLGVGLPPPEEFGLPPLDKPTFELRLSGTPLSVVGELFAVYAVGKIPVGEEVATDSDAIQDVEVEARARELVTAAGLEWSERGFSAEEDSAVSLWQTELERLRASEEPRFEVFVADSLSRVTVRAPLEIDVRVSSEVGWLDVQLEFRASSLRVEIDRMHAALVANRRWVVLSDGSLAKIADDVATFFSEVAPLYQGEGASRLPPHQFGRIARWLELADRPDAHVRVSLDARTRELHHRVTQQLMHARALVPSDFEATLRPYQLAGLAWLQTLRELGAGGLLADDMGLGKTITTLAFLARWRQDAGPKTALVVCPTSVSGNWIREAARFTPGLRVLAWTHAGRSVDDFDEHDVVVTTYGILRREIDRIAKRRLRCVVLDEAQNIKNPAAATSRAARRLDAEMRIALTGTPVENRLSELWSLMTYANPGMLGTAAEFDAKYERVVDLRPDGVVASELRAIVRPFLLRRTKAEVLVDLPPKTEIERACVFGLRQKRAYDALALAAREAVRRDAMKRGRARVQLTALTAILRLRQMACDPRLVDREARPEDSAKRAVFLDLVRELVSEDRRALVFSQFVELLSLWREDLDRERVAYEYLDGSTVSRDAVIERFQNGTAPLMLVSLKAGGSGLNLTAADTVIHCDPWWNPAVEDQATDRAHRIGQTRPVTVVRLVARGSIEDKVRLLQRKKSELAKVIFDSPEGPSSAWGSLSEDEVATLLGDIDAAHDEDTFDEPE